MDYDENHGIAPGGLSFAKQRLLAVVLGVVAIGGVGIVLAQFGFTSAGNGAPEQAIQASAAGVSVIVPGKKPSVVAAAQPIAGTKPSASSLKARYVYPADGSIVSVSGIWAGATADGPNQASKAQVDADHISLFNGRVQISKASMRAQAKLANGRARGNARLVQSTRVVVDGHAVPLRANQQIVVAGVGTVAINEQALVADAAKGDKQTGPRFHIVGSAVHVRLSKALAGLPAGSQIEIGRVEASVRTGEIVALPAAARSASRANNGRGSAGQPKPGTTTLPRKSTSVRGNVSAALGNMQGYAFPVLGESNYSNTWGAARASTGRHEGTDIFAAEGTPIIAIADGTLDRVGWNSIGGYRFWLFDKYGNGFYYAHESAFAPVAQDGASVRAGDVIAFVGHTGDAQGTPDHVHFEVHPGGGAATNPFPFLNAWKHGSAAPNLPGVTGVPTTIGSLMLLTISDIASNSSLGGSPLSTVHTTSSRPISDENSPVATDKSLRAAINGGGID